MAKREAIREVGESMMRTRDAAEKMKRKAKDCGGEEFSNSSSLFQLKRRRSRNSTCSSSELENSDDHPLASCCSSTVSGGISKENLTITDLQEVSSGCVEIAATATFNVEQTERNRTTSSSDLQAEETELESTAAPPSMSDRSTQAKMPSNSELEEFFSAAERDLQKQFSKKYNFDIVKEEPLEGRYEWVRVKP